MLPLDRATKRLKVMAEDGGGICSEETSSEDVHRLLSR